MAKNRWKLVEDIISYRYEHNCSIASAHRAVDTLCLIEYSNLLEAIKIYKQTPDYEELMSKLKKKPRGVNDPRSLVCQEIKKCWGGTLLSKRAV